jgi:L-asparaginase II
MVDHEGQIIFQRGDGNTAVFMRSLAKPFQALAVVESGAAKQFDLSSSELALMCGSHNGTSEQTQVLEGVMHKIGVGIADLQCGTSIPLDRKTAEQLTRDNLKPTALHHPCSGKHLGMLAVCHAKRWEIEGYAHVEHPIQQYITERLKQTLLLEDKQYTLALDGCSVPTYGVPVHKVALGFARLGMMADDSSQVIAQAMREHPVLMSGQRRMDTTLILATNGRIIAKDGTEGIFGCAVPEKGIGLALKISDGSSRAIMPVVKKVLRDHDIISEAEAETLTTQFPLDMRIHTGEKAGEMRVVS